MYSGGPVDGTKYEDGSRNVEMEGLLSMSPFCPALGFELLCFWKSAELKLKLFSF